MKKLIITLVLLFAATKAKATVDIHCMMDCMDRGYMYSTCKAQCDDE